MDLQNSHCDKVKVVYYTYPQCAASWAMQRTWEELLTNFKEFVSLQICMTGVPQLPALGHETARTAKVPRDMACLAVKAASLQSQWTADLYLAELRKACMVEHQDISKLDVLVQIARQVSKNNRGIFDLHRFGQDFDSRACRQSLYEDQQKIRINNITESPTLTFTIDGKGIKVSGYQRYQRFADILHSLSARVQFAGSERPEAQKYPVWRQ
ncbi:DsbA family protein [Dyadobacter sp. CY261]|uniref:DsbA family oxidoreductase n=1 Tax=Dyadobacter sp. CY261 TaxID=2907203 RepID=UPI001F435FC4|nr:DsbA family protein [Dyadobacter sp. CY261]MCF0072812.1 DsbA family protein [Dyadobacter sp. CY261]